MNQFDLGKVTVSEAANHTLQQLGLSAEQYLDRYRQHDWGDVSESAQLSIENAIQAGLMVRARYLLGADDQDKNMLLMIETADDRSHTVVSLRSERVFTETNMLEGYAIWSQSYDKQGNPLIDIEEPVIDKILDELFFNTVLDIGTGTGRWAFKLAKRGAQVTAMDQSPEMLAMAKTSAATQGLEIDFHQLSLWDTLPFQPGQFDLITSGLMFSHIDDLHGAFSKFYGLLAPGGKLLFSAFHPDALAHGWRTAVAQPGVMLALHNSENNRVNYLEALADAGFHILKFIDIPIHEAPSETMPPTMNPAYRFLNICLVVLAEKPEE